MTDLTNQWYQAIRISPIESDDEDNDDAATVSSTQTQNHDYAFDESKTEPQAKKYKDRPSHGTILSI